MSEAWSKGILAQRKNTFSKMAWIQLPRSSCSISWWLRT